MIAAAWSVSTEPSSEAVLLSVQVKLLSPTFGRSRPVCPSDADTFDTGLILSLIIIWCVKFVPFADLWLMSEESPTSLSWRLNQ